MNTITIEEALHRLGERVVYSTDIEMLLVGGAAAMLTNLVPRQRTTIDCDVMVYMPEGAMPVVESAADAVAAELSLPAGWLNSDVQIRVDTLPDGWDRRRVMVGTFGRLRIFAASRPDLIAMKVIAGRAQDLDDLGAMRVRQDEREFVRSHLMMLKDRGTSQEQIESAFEVLDSLKVHEHE